MKQVLTTDVVASISDMSRRYFWWAPVKESDRSVARQIAQIMHLGTYDDIRRLEKMVGESVLADVLVQSEPGWFDDRSWQFWRGRLSLSGRSDIPEQRPQRTFAHAQVL